MSKCLQWKRCTVTRARRNLYSTYSSICIGIFYARVNAFWADVALCSFILSYQVAWCFSGWGPLCLQVTEQKRDGSLGCTQGELRQTEYGTKCYQLSVPCADGVRHGWANLTAPKVREGLRFPPVWIFVSARLWVCAGLHMCSHSWGERAQLETDFSLGHHIISERCSASRPLNTLPVKAEKRDLNSSSACCSLLWWTHVRW